MHTSTKSKRAAGFLGGWTAGEGLRRPVPLMGKEERTRGGHRCYGSDEDCDSDDGGGGERKKRGDSGTPAAAESAEKRWIRERDDWLFGRSVCCSLK